MEVFGSHGLPMSLYTDRAHYFTPTRAAKLIARDRRRSACIGASGVEHIAATRRRRATLGAGVSHLAGSTGQGAGTQRDRHGRSGKPVLCDVYIPNITPVRVAAAQEGTAFVAIPGVDLARFMRQEERQVGNDNCVSFNRLKLQIPESRCAPISSRRA